MMEIVSNDRCGRSHVKQNYVPPFTHKMSAPQT